VDRLFDDLWARAKNLVIGFMDEIEAFADSLQANDGRLAGHEVEEAIRHAVNGWPTPLSTAKAKHRAGAETARHVRVAGQAVMSGEELASAWAAADEAVRSGKLPASLQARRSVPISSGSDAFY
jgi:hypothetical protein